MYPEAAVQHQTRCPKLLSLAVLFFVMLATAKPFGHTMSLSERYMSRSAYLQTVNELNSILPKTTQTIFIHNGNTEVSVWPGSNPLKYSGLGS